MPPLAYFLTWTTYGTRLHGDERGTVDRDHNRRGTPTLPEQPKRHAANARLLAHPPLVLDDSMRGVVERAITDHAALRTWRIIALNVRTNHVHLVIDCRGSHSPEAAMQQLKAWGTRRLISAGLIVPTTRVWTDHGSTRYVNTEVSLAAAVDYVLNQQ